MWRSEKARTDDVRFDFTSISVSAIASYQCTGEETEEEQKCLYLQIDTGDDDDDDDEEGMEHEKDECDGEMDIREVKILFEKKEELERAFQAMCDGALRNPDSDIDDEEGGSGGFFFDADSMVMGESFDRSIDLQEWYV